VNLGLRGRDVFRLRVRLLKIAQGRDGTGGAGFLERGVQRDLQRGVDLAADCRDELAGAHGRDGGDALGDVGLFDGFFELGARQKLRLYLELMGVAARHGLGDLRARRAQPLHRLLGSWLAGNEKRFARAVAIGERKHGMGIDAVAVVVHRLQARYLALARRQNLQVAISR